METPLKRRRVAAIDTDDELPLLPSLRSLDSLRLSSANTQVSSTQLAHSNTENTTVGNASDSDNEPIYNVKNSFLDVERGKISEGVKIKMENEEKCKSGTHGKPRCRLKSAVGETSKYPETKQSRTKVGMLANNIKVEDFASKVLIVPNDNKAGIRENKARKIFALTEANFEPINCWWEKQANKNGIQVSPIVMSPNKHKWAYLEHNGLLFTPGYEPHNVPVSLNREMIQLPPEAEEIANYWCAAMESDYGTKEKFIDNFWTALISKLPSTHLLIIRNAKFKDVDFSKIKAYLDDQREAVREKRKAASKLEREIEKQKKEQEEGPYLYALFDWLREKVGVFKSEPPSLFRGRGDHPKMGMLKRRIFPEEVTLNCHEDAPVPRLPPDMIGHSWKDIVHDNSVSWLAFYKDSVNGQFKYTFLGAGSAVKGQKDYMKYEKARRLRNHIDHIRKDYTEKMKSQDIIDRQLGTATYMLDALALRVGNEKDSSEEADTVGCCSLRLEHITFNKDNSSIALDFLGKDSIRYLNTVTVDPLVLRNLIGFCKGKQKEDVIFDKISTGVLNKYLRDLMPSLSAKVFRTYNASVTLQLELDKLDKNYTDVTNPEMIKQFYDSANREVAILCNHQRSVPKQHESSMDKMKTQLYKTETDILEIKAYIEWFQGKRTKPFVFDCPTQQVDENTVARVPIAKPGMKFEAAEKKLLQLEKKRTTLELRMQMKDANKTVSNSTSKQHYMDPRITVGFCKKWELPIEKLFNTTLRKKFPWAMYSRSDFVF